VQTSRLCLSWPQLVDSYLSHRDAQLTWATQELQQVDCARGEIYHYLQLPAHEILMKFVLREVF